MKKIFLIFSFLLLTPCLWANGSEASDALEQLSCEAKDIIGLWQYHKYIYQGKKLDPPNPRLVLTFEFRENGENELKYYRKNQEGHCLRRGRFIFKDCHLMDQITWVDPQNNNDCGRDPDMQMGKSSTTRAEIIDGEFHFYLTLGNEPLVYVWKKLSN